VPCVLLHKYTSQALREYARISIVCRPAITTNVLTECGIVIPIQNGGVFILSRTQAPHSYKQSRPRERGSRTATQACAAQILCQSSQNLLQ
jgi:hypothetical protein